MVAVYDYDPLKQSPSKDKSKELNLKKGQYVTVVGDMVRSNKLLFSHSPIQQSSCVFGFIRFVSQLVIL